MGIGFAGKVRSSGVVAVVGVVFVVAALTVFGCAPHSLLDHYLECLRCSLLGCELKFVVKIDRCRREARLIPGEAEARMWLWLGDLL